jgi:hypothetical protein
MKKLKQIMPAPDNIILKHRIMYQGSETAYHQNIIAYGLYENGLEIVPLVIDIDTGELKHIDPSNVITTYIETT